MTETVSRECCICYDAINSTANICIPACGHEFCCNCMMKHLQRSNLCPCCRATLVEANENEEDDEDDEDFDDETIEDEDEEDYEPEDGYPIEQLVAAFEAKGYGLLDALSLLMYRFSKTDPKYTKAYIRQLEADIEDINEELQNERDETMDMSSEDVNQQIP